MTVAAVVRVGAAALVRRQRRRLWRRRLFVFMIHDMKTERDKD